MLTLDISHSCYINAQIAV